MPRVNVAVVSATALAAVVVGIGFAYFIVIHEASALGPSDKSPAHRRRLGDPNDSPVTVRGGSVIAITQKGWTPSTMGFMSQATVNTSSVSLSGVGPMGSSTRQSVSLSGITTNWKITIHFRHSDGSDDTDDVKNNRLILSTCPSGSTNCVGTALTSPGPLYLYEESLVGGGFTLDPPLDGYARLRYELTMCDSSTSNVRDSACNHIASIKVEGVPQWAASNPFGCPGGECDIGVGP